MRVMWPRRIKLSHAAETVNRENEIEKDVDPSFPQQICHSAPQTATVGTYCAS